MTRIHRIDLDQFDRVVRLMASFEEALEDAEIELAKITTDLPKSWEGTTADAFFDESADWTAAAKESRDELKRLRAVGEMIITNYHRAFRANAQMLNGL